jgi:hypothetical protein
VLCCVLCCDERACDSPAPAPDSSRSTAARGPAPCQIMHCCHSLHAFPRVMLCLCCCAQGCAGVDIAAAPSGLEEQYQRVLTPDAVQFLADIHREFEAQVAQVSQCLSSLRTHRAALTKTHFARSCFKSESSDTWTCAAARSTLTLLLPLHTFVMVTGRSALYPSACWISVCTWVMSPLPTPTISCPPLHLRRKRCRYLGKYVHVTLYDLISASPHSCLRSPYLPPFSILAVVC